MAEEKKSFEDIQAYAEEIISGYAERDKLYIEIEDAYLLNEVDMPQKDWVKISMSPDARNKTLGAVRLLTAAEPKWTAPRDKNKDTEQRHAGGRNSVGSGEGSRHDVDSSRPDQKDTIALQCCIVCAIVW